MVLGIDLCLVELARSAKSQQNLRIVEVVIDDAFLVHFGKLQKYGGISQLELNGVLCGTFRFVVPCVGRSIS